MDEILKQIHYYAQQLKGINMWQAAGDYDYISSFLDSPRWNDGEYYGVVPRGEETVDEYSHNCPIPFTANRCLVSRCYDNDKALEILNKLSEIFNTLKSDVSGDGLTAINAYIENTNRYIELFGGEPVPPGPEPPVYDTYYAGGIISPDTSIDFVVTKPDKTFFTVDNISLTGFMIPTSVENTVYGNQTATSQNIVINNNDVDLILYDSNGEPITDQSKLYAIMQLNGTGSGSTPEEDDISKPLMLKATQDNSSVSYGGAVSLPYTYSYSMDGTTWINYSLNTIIPLNKDEVVYFKRNGHTGSGTPSTYNHHKFTMTGEIEAYHNVNSMLIEGDFETADTLSDKYCGIYMFAECASLTRAPLLPATTLAEYCYYCMFYMCTNLVTAPELHATTLARFCYSDMFHGCANLVNAPELPVMTLLKGCYNGMFYDCSGLANAPLLPATSLVEACYKYMFGGCTNLSYIRIFATDISATSCLTYWLQNASSTGDIYCVNGVNYPTGDDGIPSGWTRHDI